MIMKTEHIKNTGQIGNKGQMRKLPGGGDGQWGRLPRGGNEKITGEGGPEILN